MAAYRGPLQATIADFLEAEERGMEADRDTLIVEKRGYADSLGAFFAKHI